MNINLEINGTIEQGDILITKDNAYLVCEKSSEFYLVDLKYTTIRSKKYLSLDILNDEVVKNGIETHGGSCHSKVFRVVRQNDYSIEWSVNK